MAFIRQSKYRHVFGKEAKKDLSYEGFRVTNCAFEGYFIAANKKFVAFCVEVGGGGAFFVQQVDKTGRLDPNQPKIFGHKEYVLDLQWNPFNDNMIASCSEDGSIRIWEIPDFGILTEMNSDKALLSLEYHERRVVQIRWNPVASNVLMSVSQEPKICVWNLDEGVAEVEIDNHPDIIYGASWSNKGNKIVTACKDKKIRIFNARSGDLLVESKGHEGSKPSRVVFVMEDNFLLSCGFSRMSERQYAVWKIGTKDLEQVADGELDTANGCLIPYYDPDINIAYLAAKGDSVIRYYELDREAPYIHYLSTYQSKLGQRGLGRIPKRSVDVNSNEITKFYKLTMEKNIGVVQPVSFTVPRKSDLFQEDIFPDCISDEAAQEASDWFEGKDVEPNRVDMSTFFVGKSRPKPGASGGLKKAGGLKGLKAKKSKEDTPKEVPAKKSPSPEPSKPSAARASPSPSPTPSPSPATATASAGSDPKVVKDLQNEIKALKDNEKKMQKDLKAMNDKMSDYDKLTKDVKLLVDAVKKNDERIAALEALVQEESEEEQ